MHHTTRPHPWQGALMAGAAALALLATGCSSAPGGAWAGSCRDDLHWSDGQRAAWLRSAVAFRNVPDTSGGPHGDAAVLIGPRSAGVDRPLCRPLAVRVEVWALTGSGRGTEMSSVMRYRLSADGSRRRAVGFPAGLPADRYGDGGCTAALVAVYPGASLTRDELPDTLPAPATVTDADVRFRTDRIAVHRVLAPADPAGCDTGRSAAHTSPSPATSWDAYHP